MQLITPRWDAPANVAAVSTTRTGGVSLGPYAGADGKGGLNLGIHVGDVPAHVAANRALLRGVLPAEPAWLNQVHGTTVVDAATAADVPHADASVSSAVGSVCVVQTADCLPVLLCDSKGSVVGAAHAGWRGLAGGVLQATVARMRQAGGKEIIAWMGPAIGPEAFEVGPDVVDAFVCGDAQARAAFKPYPGHSGKYLADIYALARGVLRSAGVERIWGGDCCTVGDAGRFYSYRRDKITGRMASLIWLKPA
ncbi:MAG TPA: peptidoglycan editing factor PgeF [Noviherbaspirillum sp.]|jgi:YfiH family protein|uniref:peptidoglycan editing factor PgeF n=1 Tax=Noviherbaspirillum sp. TaxID=1926288 RepID=UPI002F95262A